jgi:peptidyl-prolyl cis-trans isomerase B (cyclophilin B)
MRSMLLCSPKAALNTQLFVDLLFHKKAYMTTSDPIVVLNTNKGTIKVQIYKSGAPKTAENFLDLVAQKFYDGLTFHRYEPGFCIQGGDPKGTGTGGYKDPVTKRERTIPLEVSKNLKHDTAGILAMARSNDPNSASSQFYFTLAPATFLDMNYAVFGKVTEGLDVVLALRAGDRMTDVHLLTPATK